MQQCATMYRTGAVYLREKRETLWSLTNEIRVRFCSCNHKELCPEAGERIDDDCPRDKVQDCPVAEVYLSREQNVRLPLLFHKHHGATENHMKY